MNVIKYKYVFLSFSGILVLASVAAYALWGLKPGIDFTGGSILEVEFPGPRPASADIEHTIAELRVEHAVIQPSGERGMIVRMPPVDEETHRQIINALSIIGTEATASGLHPLIAEKRFDTVGPTIGADLTRRAVLAVILAIFAIIAYIAWAFRAVSKPVASWKYGIATLVALIHDVAIPIGAFSALGRFKGVEIDPLFITAILTVLGFSVHDTIVVFDRIRENLQADKSMGSFPAIVNASINQTLVRSLMTSLTVLMVLAVIFFLGGASTKYFALALIIGITFGTYSSIFVASPIVVVWQSSGAALTNPTRHRPIGSRLWRLVSRGVDKK